MISATTHYFVSTKKKIEKHIETPSLLQEAVFRYDRLSVFTFTWAVASLLHILSFNHRLTSANPALWLALAATAAVIMFPGSAFLFMVMLFFRIADYINWMPFTPNHLLFECLLNICILSALLYRYFIPTSQKGIVVRKDTKAVAREGMINLFSPVLAVCLVILYAYAVFHKLNDDFFNPVLSCSTYLMEHFTSEIPTINNNAFIRMTAVWGTLVFEAGIPLLLIFRRTRTIGILAGLFFHFLLAFHPIWGIYSFSAMLFSLYFLFAPTNLIERLREKSQKISGNNWGKFVKALGFSRLLFLVAVLPLIYVLRHSPQELFRVGFILWLSWATIVIAVCVTIVFFDKTGDGVSAKNLFQIPVNAFLIFPVIVAFNGLSPYLGLKTQTSFSMFSNLRTEGDITNHFFVPTSWQVGSFQKDLVDIISTDAKELAKYKEHNQLITYFELRRITSSLKKDFRVEYTRNGQKQLFEVQDGKGNQAELMSPHPWLLGKLLAFRPIDKGPCLCKH